MEPYLIEEITNAHGDRLYRHDPSAASQVYDVGRSREMVEMMQGVVSHGTGKRAALDRPAAGKTGTSQDWRDAWFVGFTPDWIAGVWVGNDRAQPMAKVAGGDLPSEIWRRFMLAAEDGAVYRVRTPRLPIAVNGAGDCVAALFLVHRARTGSAAAALGAAAASVHGLLRRTLEAGSREILTVEAQDEFVAPGETFPVEAV